jgi:uncharacterized protein
MSIPSAQEPPSVDPLADSSAADTAAGALEVSAFKKGVDEFNRQAFYDCHDTLEAIWMEAETAEKPFYQGILQIAVAFYHLGNRNWRGGAILLGEGISRLQRFEPTYEGIRVDALLDQAIDWLELIQSAGPEGLEAIMTDLPHEMPQIQWVTGHSKK